LAPERDVAPLRPRSPRRARLAPPPRRLGHARAFPRRAHLPQTARTPRHIGICPYRTSRQSHALDRQSVPCPCACAPSEMKPCARRSSSAPRLASHHLFKAARPPPGRTRPRRPAPQAATAPPWPPTVSFPLHATGLPFVHALATMTLYHSLQSRGLLGRTGILAGMLDAAAAAAPSVGRARRRSPYPQLRL
jgi:hypothetical protein